ncbi:MULTISPECIES: MarR family winged helix-turn-helix transcriptional regulator [Sphingomonas]|jgi:MarR family transcriptional regulator, organic hydroperoxide resistance regulator|uniref:MarR family transcriptional regulator n=1 Tax=Sphingomonas zeae TaxID=1646122 RepID=A0A7Y6B5F0_9SPHN|nr:MULTISPECIES: MarR family transcriptional regulator [Sphingomonas]MBB4048458.1 DNA-binding MarR family transcriptional regulator [Sphingomonas zeae]MDK8187271.1 MarR family transcriptional regulator [Sphingomonas zeae]MDK8217013.1 MarR family transcriptional regulator [Sphingomonas sp. UMB7805-LC452B]NUU46861.1 MarR family transcriptional regulator [Sphingomonas zeae]
MSAPWPLDEQLCFAVYAANMAIQRSYKPMLDRLGLTYPQYLALHVLWEEDGRTIGAIAQRLSLESSTVTPLVKRLEAAGLLMRERDPQDERQVRVRLTPVGHDMRDRCGCLGEDLITRSGMGVDDLRALKDEVQSLRRALERREPAAA